MLPAANSGGEPKGGNRLRISACSHVGLVRPSNEDNYCAIDLNPVWPGFLLAVADGMGGHEAGEEASALAMITLQDYVRKVLEAGDEGPPEDIMARAIVAADRAVSDEARSRGITTMGTTLTAFLVGGGKLYWGHVGDSRAYLVSPDTLDKVTQDHSLVGEMIRQGSLTEDEALAHPQRNILTSALGGSLKDTDGGARDYRPGDCLVLCTDGLFSLVPGPEIAQIVRVSNGAEDFESLAERLVALANDRGGHDNITVLVVELK